MNFTQLNVFREVMRSGSISQTARKLGRTQPAISLAIKNLEQSLDLKLFERRGRQLVPVPEAQYLLAEASEILDRMTAVSSTMKSLRNTQSGNLNVAVMPGPSAFIFPRFISQITARNTDFLITLSSRSSGQIRELANTQSIDFGFADFDEPTGRAPQYHAEIISTDCFCALHPDHHMAGRDRLTAQDLVGEPIGMLHGDHPLPRKLEKIFHEADAHLNSVVSSQFFLPLIPFISSGHCCSIVDPLTMITEQELNISKGQVTFLPFDAAVRYEYAILVPLHRPPSLLARRIKSEWAKELLAMLQAVGASPVCH